MNFTRCANSFFLSCLVALAACRAEQHGPGSDLVAPAALAARDPLESIARCEDQRTDGDGFLEVVASHGDEKVRERAITALGRLPARDFGARVGDVLESALKDDEASIRKAAAFALGQRAEVETVDALLARKSDSDSSVRARVIEALSRIDDPRARRAVVDAFYDQTESVASEAAAGTARFPAGAPDAQSVDTALIQRLQLLNEAAREVRAVSLLPQIYFALGRRKSSRARLDFVQQIGSLGYVSHLFALQGLAAVGTTDPDKPEIAQHALTALRDLLADDDWRVACEAANVFARHPDPNAIDALIFASRRASPAGGEAHVRRAVIEALGESNVATTAVLDALKEARKDASSSVRAAAVTAEAKLTKERALDMLATAAKDADPIVRSGAAAGYAFVPVDRALAPLKALIADADLRTAGIAIESLGAFASDPRVRAILRELLANRDNGLRLGAVTEIAKSPTAEDLAPLAHCLDTSHGEISAEIAAGIVDAAAKVGGDEGFTILASAWHHDDPFVARKARDAARKLRPDADVPRDRPVAQRGTDLPPVSWNANPRVVVTTSKGVMTFELFANETPFHVWSFLELARKGHYDGLRFHRVVPDFVIQGGDTRGDGNGGTSWRGDPLRSEFTPRKFVRGSLGMPRNDDPDSGGSQIFVTHRETPHLDGRYTLFGQLISGFDVLDAIEVGDRILSVKIAPESVPAR